MADWEDPDWSHSEQVPKAINSLSLSRLNDWLDREFGYEMLTPDPASHFLHWKAKDKGGGVITIVKPQYRSPHFGEKEAVYDLDEMMEYFLHMEGDRPGGAKLIAKLKKK